MSFTPNSRRASISSPSISPKPMLVMNGRSVADLSILSRAQLQVELQSLMNLLVEHHIHYQLLWIHVIKKMAPYPYLSASLVMIPIILMTLSDLITLMTLMILMVLMSLMPLMARMISNKFHCVFHDRIHLRRCMRHGPFDSIWCPTRSWHI